MLPSIRDKLLSLKVTTGENVWEDESQSAHDIYVINYDVQLTHSVVPSMLLPTLKLRLKSVHKHRRCEGFHFPGELRMRG